MVQVTGMSVDEATQAINKHLTRYLDNPSVSVDVFSFASKKYYVISAGAGNGDTIQSFLVTGNETALTAIAQVQGISQLPTKKCGSLGQPLLEKVVTRFYPSTTMPSYAGKLCDELSDSSRRPTIHRRRPHAGPLESHRTSTGTVERLFGFALLGGNTFNHLIVFPKKLPITILFEDSISAAYKYGRQSFTKRLLVLFTLNLCDTQT